MSVAEVEKLALSLSIDDRAQLLSRLQESLPPCYDDDEGVAEALRRAKELDAHPELAIPFEEIDRRIKARRR